VQSTEGDWGRDYYEVVKRIRSLPNAYDRAFDATPLSNSVRAADDLATGRLVSGQYIQYCVAQAIDACVGIERMTTSDRGIEVPLSATYPLSRAAIESASVALWIMRAATRRERVLRRLQVADDELRYERRFTTSVSVTEEPSRREAIKRAHARDAKRVKDNMRAVANASKIGQGEYVDRFPGWDHIVDDAGPLIYPEKPSLLVSSWRFTSGLSHPSFMRGLVAHEFAPSAAADESVEGMLSGSLSWITATAHVAETITRRSIVMYRLSKALINGERPVPDPAH